MSKLTHRLAAAFVSAAVLFTFGSAWAARTSESYAKMDHLMAQWDGIENVGRGLAHDSAATTWVDLVHAGGSSALDMAVAAAQAEWTENGLKRKSGSGLFASASAKCDTYLTIEIVMDAPTTTPSCILQAGAKHHLICYKLGGIECGNAGPSFACSSDSATRTFVYSSSTASTGAIFYENGARVTTSGTTDTWGDKTNFQIGSYDPTTSNYPYNGTIYAIRLYDCQLTAEEIAKNARIDRVRFFGESDLGDPMTVTGAPAEYDTNPSSAFYGTTNVVEADVLSVPAKIQNGSFSYTCTGWKLYEGDGTQVAGAVGAGSGNEYTVTADDVGSGRKLEWQWQETVDYIPATYYAARGNLCAQWDGCYNAVDANDQPCHDADATTWRDLVGGLEFQLTGVTINLDHLDFSGAKDDANVPTSYGMIASTAPGFANAFFSGVKTFEIVANINAYAGAAFMGSSTSCMGLGIDGNRLYPTPGNTATLTKPSLNNVHTISYVENCDNRPVLAWENGVNALQGGSSYSHFDGNAWIGRSKEVGSGFDGQIYAIRIYNRLLTAKERALNLFLDDVRFRGKDGATAGLANGLRLNANNEVECEIAFDGAGYGTVSVNGSATAEQGSVWVTLGSTVTLVFTPKTDKIKARFFGLPDNATSSAANTWSFTADGGVTAKAQLELSTSMYTQMGLISQWDGIDNQATGTHDPTATTWVDLVNGYTYNLYNGIRVEQGGLFFGANRSYASMINAAQSTAAFPSGAKTIEIVFETEVAGVVWESANNCNLTFYPNGSMVILSHTGTARKGFGYKTFSLDTYSAKFDDSNVPLTADLYLNGEHTAASATSGQLNSPNAFSYLGSRTGGSNFFFGRICAIRAYSGALSQSAIEFNAALDRIRFSGADANEEFEKLGIRYNENTGEFEYRLKVTTGSDGTVKVNGAAAVQDYEGYSALGAQVTLEFVPSEGTIFRSFSGAPADAVQSSVHQISFTFNQPTAITMARYAYEDDYVVSDDPGVLHTTVGPRQVYAFTNFLLTAGAVLYPKGDLTVEERLLVAGGGAGGGRASGGGGGGGVLSLNNYYEITAGLPVRTIIGRGGQTEGLNGGNTSYADEVTAAADATAIGGGGGNGHSGGSGGGNANGAAGSGTAGQGFAGSSNFGGGGGASAAGTPRVAVADQPGRYCYGRGGDGRTDAITGTAHCYGSGGGCGTGGVGVLVTNELGQIDYGQSLGLGGKESGGRGGVGIEGDPYMRAAAGVNGLGGGGGSRGDAGNSTMGPGGSGVAIVAFTVGHGKPHFAVAPVDPTRIDDQGTARPVPTVTDAETGNALVAGTHYQVSYELNDTAGLGWVVITGLGEYSGVMQRTTFTVREYIPPEPLPSTLPTSLYVADGLKALWDGIYNATNASGEFVNSRSTSEWVDQVGGLAFAMTRFVEIGGGYYNFDGSLDNGTPLAYGWIEEGTDGLGVAFSAGAKTVEIVALTRKNASAVFMGTATANIGLGIDANRMYPVSANDKTISLAPLNVTNTIVYTKGVSTMSGAWVNNVNALQGGSTYSHFDGNAWIGRSKEVGSAYDGRVYALRIYDRELSAAERAINHFVDGVRYLGKDGATSGLEAGIRLNANNEIELRLDLDGKGFGSYKVNGGEPIEEGSVWIQRGETVSLVFTTNSDKTKCILSGLPTDAVTAPDGTISFTVKVPAVLEAHLDVPVSLYAQAGLLAQWDGIDNQATGTHDPTATTWKDTQNGYSFSLSSVAIEENCLYFNGAADGTLANANAAFPAGTKTVEVVFKADSSSGVVLQGPSAGPFVFQVNNNLITLSNVNGVPRPCLPRSADTISTYTLPIDAQNVPMTGELFRDGEPIAASGSAAMNNSTANYAYIGKRGSNNDTRMTGRIYAIRVYSRTLTPAEIALNAALDRVRFRGANLNEELAPLGMRFNGETGEYEYKVSVATGSDGAVAVNGAAAVADYEGWFSFGSQVSLEFKPANGTIFRDFVGIPADASRPSVHAATFTIGQPAVASMEQYAYEDEFVVGNDAGVVHTTVGPREVYVFTNIYLNGGAKMYSKCALTVEERLIVAGGGEGGDRAGGGGGAGGVLHLNNWYEPAVGSLFTVQVGKGGSGGVGAGQRGHSGENSVYSDALTAAADATAIGGGGGGAISGGSGGGGVNGNYGRGTEGQGHDGYGNAGGGGGAEAMGGTPVTVVKGRSRAAAGGAGRWDNITGTLGCYGPGGGCGSGDPVTNELGEACWDQTIGWGGDGAFGGGWGGLNISDTTSDWYQYRNGGAGKDGFGGGGGSRSGGGSDAGPGGYGTVIVAFTKGHGKPHFAIDEIGSFPLDAATGRACPKPAIYDTTNGDLLEEGTHYTLSYVRNDTAGLAIMEVTGLGAYADIMQRQDFRVKTVKYVKPDGTGDGKSWATATDIQTAIQSLESEPGDIWCAAGTYDLTVLESLLRISTETTIRGGFAADDPSDVAKLAADGAKSVFDCGGTVLYSFYVYTSAVRPDLSFVTFENCTFAHATSEGIFVNCNCSVKFDACDFIGNMKTDATMSTTGDIGYFNGPASATLTFTGCGFYGNGRDPSQENGVGSGYGGLYVPSFGKVVLDGCTFATNGMPRSFSAGTKCYGYANRGAIIYIAPQSVLKNCRFVGNRGNAGCMSLFLFEGRSTIENCTFVANDIVSIQGAVSTSSSMIGYRTGNFTNFVRNCTFAYNATSAGQVLCAADGGANTPTLMLENSIFYGNQSSAAVKDVYAPGSSTRPGQASYTWFGTNEFAACCGPAASMTEGPGVLYGDPKFETDILSATNLLQSGTRYYQADKTDELMAIDVHLKLFSPAVNKGNPKSDYSQEPKPNGKRINMGAYGGTSEATCTPPGGVLTVR